MLTKDALGSALATILAAVAGLGPQIAFAADLPFAQTPIFVFRGINWDGLYAGIHGGVAEGSASWSNPTGLFALIGDVPGSSPQQGLFGGAQLGYNRQFGFMVVGVEGDVSVAPLDGSTVCGAIVGFGGSGDPCHTRTDLMASVTGRLGYAVGRALFYGKAGAAFADEHYDINNLLFDPALPAQASAGRFGWTVGAGIEYALAGNWSAFTEWNYYGFGARTVDFTIPLIPGVSSFSISRNQYVAKFGLNYRLAGIGADRSAPASQIVSDLVGEFGVRTGFSSGRFQKNLFDPFVRDQLNSRLTWQNQSGISLESFARVNHVSGFFAKGYVGGIDLFGSQMHDEDFPPGALPYSNTVSTTSNGRDVYADVDVGYSFLRGNGWKLDGFLGYHYYAQRMNAFGCTQTAGSLDICPAGSVPANALSLSQTEHWNAARVGVGGGIFINEFLKLRAEAAWLPYMSYSGQDNHWLRPDINPLFETGYGFNGFQLESILNYAVTDRVDVGIGARYWQFYAQHGLTQFPGAPPSSEQFSSSRFGVFVQSSYKFGDFAAPPVTARY